MGIKDQRMGMETMMHPVARGAIRPEKDTFLGFYGDPYFKPTYNFRYPLGTEGMNDEHKWLSVTAGLIKRGYKEEEIVKIIGGNWLRVIGEVVG